MDRRVHWMNNSSQKIFVAIWIVAICIMGNERVHGLQGVPSWMCLGLKSPFIEFKSGLETLSNLSISLNTSDANGSFGYSMLSSNSFSYAFEEAGNRSVQKHYLDLVKKQQKPSMLATASPAIALVKDEMTMTNARIHQHNDDKRFMDFIDRKYSDPLALKKSPIIYTSTEAAAAEALTKITTTSTTTSTRKPILPDTSPNIDDLKRHLLMLQNLTRNDENFQSKFVVFPSLQKSTSTSTSTTQAPTTTKNVMVPTESITVRSTTSTSTSTTRALMPTKTTHIPSTTTMAPTTKRTTSTTKKSITLNVAKQIMPPAKEEPHKFEKISIVPQVFLQNDQNLMNDDSFERPINDETSTYQRHRTKITINDPKPAFLSSTMKQAHTNGKQTQIKKSMNRNRNGNKQLRREMRKKCKALPVEQRQNCTNQLNSNLNSTPNTNTNTNTNGGRSTLNQTKRNKRINKPIENNNSNRSRPPYGDMDTIDSMLNIPSGYSKATNRMPNEYIDDQRTNDDDPLNLRTTLQRNVRSNRRHQKRNTTSASVAISTINSSSLRRRQSYANDDLTTIATAMDETITADIAASTYKERTDLNPDLCYKIGGLSYGQQKLCAANTQIMPAISRGARAAIQECKHQFKNRRWNCSTVDDDTVFGPVTALGSPEMAFINAMAAAAATSFIARACRDGQISTCGCSRSIRPRELHNDWTWGGCGDDLDFGYRFTKQFIDARENERKRSQRGIVSVPPKHKKFDLNQSSGNAQNVSASSAKDSDSSTGFKAEHLLELQEKITKEILSTKLEEKEMHRLQEKINHEILNSKMFSLDQQALRINTKKSQRGAEAQRNRYKSSASVKVRSKMNIHNNEAGRRAVMNKSRITCKCHGVSGSCSMITCWQQLTSIREIGDYLKVKYDEATPVKLNKHGNLQVGDSQLKAPTANDLVYLDDSPDWCRNLRQLQWPGTRNRVCNRTSSGLDGCAILCCGRGYNTRKIVIKERCNCRFQWCCHVKCEVCVRVVEEHICK